MIRSIIQWPSKVLTIPTRALSDEEITSAETQNLVEDLIDTCTAVDGLGLAANQIGQGLSVAVVNLDHLLVAEEGDEKPGYLIMINPTVIEAQGEQMIQEGCLSIPSENSYVKRPAFVSVEYTDLNGEQHTMGGQGLLAVALIHEIDHLEGKVYADHLPSFKRSIIRKRMTKLRKKLRQAGFKNIPVLPRKTEEASSAEA